MLLTWLCMIWWCVKWGVLRGILMLILVWPGAVCEVWWWMFYCQAHWIWCSSGFCNWHSFYWWCFWCDSFLSFYYYADDLQIFHSSSVADIQKCYDKVNADLNHDWVGSNGLKLHANKSQVILIHRGNCWWTATWGCAKGKTFGIYSEPEIDARGSF
jgi:hypothetical protein